MYVRCLINDINDKQGEENEVTYILLPFILQIQIESMNGGYLIINYDFRMVI